MIAPLAALALAVLLLNSQRLTRRVIERENRKTMSALEELRARVAANVTVTESAIALLQGLKEKLDEAANAEDPEVALMQLSEELEAETLKLSQAVAANTPVTSAGVDHSAPTADTSSPSPENLPDGHPFKPVSDPVPE